MADTVGQGWHSLVDEAIHRLELQGIKCRSYYEKYGTLRFDIEPWTKDAERILEEIEERSGHICEFCGQAGSEVVTDNGWIKTLCEKCRTKSFPSV